MRDRARLASVAALLALVVLGAGGGTEAGWTDARTAAGTTLHTGRIDLQVDGLDAVTGFAPFSLTGLEPGSSTARTLTVENAGTVPMTWTASLTATGADDLASTLTTTVTDAGTTDGSTCGGTPLGGSAALAPGATDTVCVEVALPADAPKAVAGSTAELVLTGTARTTRGAWPDTATVRGAGVATVDLTAPTLACTGALQVGWDAVPGATGYRVVLGGVQLVEVGPDGHTATLPSAGMVTVTALFGSESWQSPPSDAVAVGLTGC